MHPENSDWTCFEQKAELDIKSFFGFEGTAEKLAVKEYSKSIGKSKDIMEHYIQVNTFLRQLVLILPLNIQLLNYIHRSYSKFNQVSVNSHLLSEKSLRHILCMIRVATLSCLNHET